jgi:hypothetical protein
MKRFTLFLLVLLPLVACDDGAGGPGPLTGTISTPGPVLGGAVLEVFGKGITGFSGAGTTEAFFAPTDVEFTYRVVILSTSPGELQFQVSVEDTKAKKPTATVVTLTSGENLPLPATADYTVTFSR